MAKMEFLPPEDGWQCICNMTWQEASQASTAVMDALRVAHSCLPGGVHGDLRAANTLVRRREPNASPEAGHAEGIWEVRFIDFEVGSLDGAYSDIKRYCCCPHLHDPPPPLTQL